MDENNETSVLDDVIISEFEHYSAMSKDDDNHGEEVKLLCQLIDRSIETKKIEEGAYEAGIKNEQERELQEARLKQERELREAELKQEKELREAELKQEKIRTYIEFGKGLLILTAFMLCESMAHTRDLKEVIDTDPMHVKKNPIKLKFW